MASSVQGYFWQLSRKTFDLYNVLAKFGCFRLKYVGENKRMSYVYFVENVLGREWGKVDSCETCRRKCLYFQRMMNRIEYEHECDQDQGHHEGQHSPILGLKIFILVQKPG